MGGEGVGVLLLAHVPELGHVLRPARRQLVPVFGFVAVFVFVGLLGS